METPVTARSLFFGAIGDLLSDFGAVLKIGGPWFVIYIALSALAGRLYAHWVLYDIDQLSLPPGEWYLNVMFLVMLGTVAASWHRFMVLGEPPSFIPKMRLIIVLKYVLAWIVIGIITGLIVLVIFGLPALLLTAWVDQVLSDVVADMLGDAMFDPMMLPPGLMVFAVGFAILFVSALIFLLFRMGLGLPSVAILDGQGIGMRASWLATRGLGWPVFGASVWAALGMIALYAVAFMLLLAPDSTYTTGREVVLRIGIAVTDIVAMLVGTAVLTRIYRVVPEKSL